VWRATTASARPLSPAEPIARVFETFEPLANFSPAESERTSLQPRAKCAAHKEKPRFDGAPTEVFGPAAGLIDAADFPLAAIDG
jgi:hypothetical protein